MNRIFFILILTLLTIPFTISAQAIHPGETLTYDLYFKYGLINSKAGYSVFSTESSRYNSEEALKTTLLAKSTGLVKNFYEVNDTLISFMSMNYLPLSYYKSAFEGKDHTLENITYRYFPDEVRIHTNRFKNGGPRFDTTFTSRRTVYDMLSILNYVRTLDLDMLVQNKIDTVTYISGRRLGRMDIEYRGTENIKANDGKKYRCLKLVMILNEQAFEDRNEAMRVYITNDEKRIPIRIDTKLKRGTMRVILRDYRE